MNYQHRLLCVFVWLMALSKSSVAQYDDVLSYAVGYRGVSLIVQNSRFHSQFSISEDQVEKLKAILEDKVILEKFHKTGAVVNGRIDRNGRTRILDEFVRDRAPEILDKAQLQAIRLYFLKEQFLSQATLGRFPH